MTVRPGHGELSCPLAHDGQREEVAIWPQPVGRRSPLGQIKAEYAVRHVDSRGLSGSSSSCSCLLLLQTELVDMLLMLLLLFYLMVVGEQGFLASVGPEQVRVGIVSLIVGALLKE